MCKYTFFFAFTAFWISNKGLVSTFCLNQIFLTSFCKVIQSFYSLLMFTQSKRKNQLTAFDSSSWCNWFCYSTNTRLPGYLHFPSITLIITWSVYISGFKLRKEYNSFNYGIAEFYIIHYIHSQEKCS